MQTAAKITDASSHRADHEAGANGVSAMPPIQRMGEGETSFDSGNSEIGISTSGPNLTGLPDQMKTNLENASGFDMSDIRVHRNDPSPAKVGALAYTQGTDIYLGPGQEQHLGHEAWHSAQYKQGRVQVNTSFKSADGAAVAGNDQEHLEKEADVMGAKLSSSHFSSSPVTQLKTHGSHRSQTPQTLVSCKQAPVQRAKKNGFWGKVGTFLKGKRGGFSHRFSQFFAGLGGGILGLLLGTIGGASLGAYNLAKLTATKAWDTDEQGNANYAARIASILGVPLAFILGGLGGLVGGAVAGTALGAHTAIKGTGLGWQQDDWKGAISDPGFTDDFSGLREQFADSISDTSDVIPEVPKFEPGLRAVSTGETLSITTLEDVEETYNANHLTQLTVYEKVGGGDPVFVTFYEKKSHTKLPLQSRGDSAKYNKYARGAFHEGFTSAASVTAKFNMTGIVGSGTQWNIKYTDMNETDYPLFGPRGPVPEDIAQGVSGQCWALSALMSMAKQDPQAIRDMITHADEHTLTVRFFKEGDGSPQFIRITRNLANMSFFGVSQRISTSTGEGNASWPLLILKAYSAWPERSQDQSYQSLDGGHSNIAWRHFLGSGDYRSRQVQTADYDTVAGKVQLGNHEVRVEPPWFKNTSDRDYQGYDHVLYQLMNEGFTLDSLLGGGEHNPHMRAWCRYAEAQGFTIDTQIRGDARVTLPMIARHIQLAGIAGTPVGNAMLKAYSRYYTHNGSETYSALGISRYHDKALELFDKIKTTIDKGEYAAAGTTAGQFTAHDGQIKGGRNAIIKGGIQESHAYSIVGYREDDSGELYIRMRNPWGHQSMLVWGNAEFELTFSKFMRRFPDVYLANRREPERAGMMSPQTTWVL